jgi:hypothetical protein
MKGVRFGLAVAALLAIGSAANGLPCVDDVSLIKVFGVMRLSDHIQGGIASIDYFRGPSGALAEARRFCLRDSSEE